MVGGPGSGRKRAPHVPDRGHRDWYSLNRWRHIAKDHLRRNPLCVRCLQRGIVRSAALADHIEPHRGDWMKFRLGALQSLCADCHNRFKQGEDVRGYSGEIGDDGWPIDPRHPANR